MKVIENRLNQKYHNPNGYFKFSHEDNDISKCYRHNNILITIKERYDNWNGFHVYDIMGYWVGNKNG
jgi:hypothetical protein